MTPLFSLVIPTFNALEDLKLTLDSIRVQEFEGVEILVQDGASTDGTLAFLAAQSDVDWRSAPDGGIYDAMNRAIGRARGRFVMFVGAGDELEPGALRALADEIARAAGDKPLIVYGDAFWAARGERIGGALEQRALTMRNVCHQAMAFERGLFERLGLYDLKYRNCADWAWNIRAWGDGGIEKRYVPALIARYQGGGQSETEQDEAFNADILGLVQRHFSWPVATLYTLRRRAPQGLKQLVKHSATDVGESKLEPERAQRAALMCSSNRSARNRLEEHMSAAPTRQQSDAIAAPISVVIPTYNSGARLRQTLDSALNQTQPPLEIIVVDDGSTDQTPDFIRAHYGARVTLIEQSNGGVARARNAGWRAARGEWIAFLDHDDVWHADKLERLLVAATPAVGVVYSRWRAIDEAGAALPDAAQMTRQSGWRGASGRVFGWLFGWRCPLISMSVPLVRRDWLERVGGFDASCVPCDDWDLWLRLARVCEFNFVDAELTDYRVYPAQQSRDEAKALRAARRVLGKHRWALLARPLLAWWWLWLGAFGASLSAYNAAKNAGSRGAFFRALVGALRAHPLALLAPAWLRLLARRARGR